MIRGPPPPASTIMRGAPYAQGPPSFLVPPGRLPHPSLVRPGLPGPPPPPPPLSAPGAPIVSQMENMSIQPPAPGGPPESYAPSNVGSMSKLGIHVPLAKCRVLYIGSAVPTETAVGIEAVQQPLNDRYRTNGVKASNVLGIDAWLTAFSSGLLLQYIGDKSVITWFPIHTLHVSAAVKCVPQLTATTGQRACKFMSLDSPASKSSDHPPVFAAIMRRTTGVKVLECHAFICKSDLAALALVQGTTHAYEHKEGWTEEAPSRELYQTLEGSVNAADPSANPEVPLFQPSDSESQDKPPIKGYFQNAKDELVKSFNVHHPSVTQPGGIPAGILNSIVPPPARVQQPRPLPMVPPGAYNDPYLLPTPPPPPQYFEDWDAFHGQPVVIFPGPYMPEDEYRRTMRDIRHKKKSRTPDPRSYRYDSNRYRDSKRRERRPEPPKRQYDKARVLERECFERERTYGYRPPHPREYPRPMTPPPPRRYEREPVEYLDPRDVYGSSRRREPAPVDYVDDFGNRYYSGREEDGYGYSYRGELPRTMDRREPVSYPDDMVLYAPQYMRHIDSGGYDDYQDEDPYRMYPRNDREFSRSIAEERRLIGDVDHADPYRMNDYRSRDDLDLYRDARTYGGMTGALGYLP